MSDETNVTIDEIMRAAANTTLAEVEYQNMPGMARLDRVIESGLALRRLVTKALDGQAQQIAELTAELDALRARLTNSGCDLQELRATPAPGEWIEWRGGDAAPIADGVWHQVRLRSGGELQPNGKASALAWDHKTSRRDIVAYRILP